MTAAKIICKMKCLVRLSLGTLDIGTLGLGKLLAKPDDLILDQEVDQGEVE